MRDDTSRRRLIAVSAIALLAVFAYGLRPPASSLLLADVDLRNPPGLLIHAEFTSANASAPADEAAARMTIYEAGGTSALTLAATDQVVITDVCVTQGATLNTTVFAGTDTTTGSGDNIIVTRGGSTTTTAWAMVTPHVLPAGEYPKVITGGAGQVDVSVRGFIVRR